MAIKRFLRFGKKPAKVDVRTFEFKKILAPVPLETPDEWDVDNGLISSCPLSMFGNDRYGDCVIAARANQTLRFEDLEQNQDFSISDQDVLNEYWKEGRANCLNKHPDNGLVMLNSLNAWRKNGWRIQDKDDYKIYAFAQIIPNDHQYVKIAVYYLYGTYAGIQVPQSAMDQFNKNQPWTVSGDSTIAGGHAIFIVGYNSIGPVCVTWAKKQQMDWEFWNRYCDEAYAIIDNRENWDKKPIDIDKLDEYLKAVEKT